MDLSYLQNALAAVTTEVVLETKKTKGRTGWPQHVWAAELKQECE